MAKCPWCHDTFAMSRLVVHLPPLAELVGEDGQPISMDELAHGTASMALAASGQWAANSANAMMPPTTGRFSSSDTLDDSDIDVESLDFEESDASETANDVREFAEEGVTFAEAGYPEPSDESTEWEVDSPDQTHQDRYDTTVQVEDSDTQSGEDFDPEYEFNDQEGSPPRPLAEVTDFGMARDDRPLVPRARKKQKGSPIKSIIGVVIGGLMAFPLAAGILALAGKPLDLGFWPFDGQTISMNNVSRRSAAAPMEPTPRLATNGNNANNRPGRSLADDLPSLDLDSPTLADPAAGEPNGRTNGRPNRRPPQTGMLDNLLATPEPGPDLVEVPSTTIELPPLDLPTRPPTPVTSEPPKIEPPDMPSAASPPAASAQPRTMPLGQPETPEPAAPASNGDNASPVDSPESLVDSPESPTDPPKSPTVQSPTVPAQLQQALEAASDAIGMVVNYDDSEGVKGQRSRLAALFAKVAEVADKATPEDSAAVGSLVERLIDNDLMKELAPAAPNWLRFAKRPNNGIVAVGKLIRENEQWLLQWNAPAALEVRFADPSIAIENSDVIIVGTIGQNDSPAVVDVKYLQKR
jgi:hypothetical protein